MEEYIVVYITAESRKEADTLSHGLVENRLAYCVNVVPGITSYYYWDDKMCVDEEFLLVVKSRRNRFEALEQWVTENHSYDVPEIIALPLVAGSKPYLQSIDDWILDK